MSCRRGIPTARPTARFAIYLPTSILGPIRPKPRPVHAGPAIRLVAIDLDGTLLRGDKQICPSGMAAIREATQAGVHVVLATARPPRSTRDIHRALGLTTPTIHYNGALICDLLRDQHLYHRPLPPQLARQIVEAARTMDPTIVVSLEVLDRWYTDHVDPHLHTETSRRFAPDVVGPLDRCLNLPVTKLMFMAEPARLKPIRQMVARQFDQHVAMPASDDHLLQLVHPAVDKASALQQVAASLGVEREAVMAIGDAPNDVGMLQWAGLGAAMQNAWAEVIAQADVTVPSNEDDGVAFALRRYVLGVPPQPMS